MNIWQVTVMDQQAGNCLYWCETEIDADIAVLEKSKFHDVEPTNCTVSKWEINPTRKSFVEFLNLHFTQDNG